MECRKGHFVSLSANSTRPTCTGKTSKGPTPSVHLTMTFDLNHWHALKNWIYRNWFHQEQIDWLKTNIGMYWYNPLLNVTSNNNNNNNIFQKNPFFFVSFLLFHISQMVLSFIVILQNTTNMTTSVSPFTLYRLILMVNPSNYSVIEFLSIFTMFCWRYQQQQDLLKKH